MNSAKPDFDVRNSRRSVQWAFGGLNCSLYFSRLTQLVYAARKYRGVMCLAVNLSFFFTYPRLPIENS